MTFSLHKAKQNWRNLTLTVVIQCRK